LELIIMPSEKKTLNILVTGSTGQLENQIIIIF
jgi:hypothetical protein